ncbi:MAG: hypothetical protein Q9183_006746 [Haloplaca sp. 2 TL-2023]
MNTEKSSNVFGNENTELSGQVGTTQAAGPGPSMPEPHAPMAPGASEATYAYQHQPATSSSQPQLPPKNAFDDFDNEFGDLSEAKEADDKGDEDFTASNRGGFDEFNPTFDSPASTRTFQPQQPSQQQQNFNFSDFESNISAPSARPPQQQPQQFQPATTSHDWDAIFAGLDSPPQQQADISAGAGSGQFPKAENRPAPMARGLSEGTEHDDPIVKDMTSMGFRRDECVAALEKYDYNTDKAIEYLASKQRG